MRGLALHGFLGTGRDWNFLRESFGSRVIWNCPDLFCDTCRGESLEQEAHRLANHGLLSELNDVVLGYSYGGRLAIELALARARAGRKIPKLILVSAGFGWKDTDKRAKRALHDEAWAQDFLRLPWSELLEKWSNQEVLAAHAQSWPGPRDEELFSRAKLAEALRLRSPAMGSYSLASLAALETPVLLVVGDSDAPYLEQAHEALGQLPNARLRVIEGASHRAPWQKPREFLQILEEFL